MPERFFGTPLPNVDVNQLSGLLIALEGSDGSGRSTQVGLLKDWLEMRGYATVNVGIKRSMLVSKELEEAQQGNVLTANTMRLFYATDFFDQLENVIIPALRAGFIVLADRYIYTLIARAVVRGAGADWVKNLYSPALVPDAVFYLRTSPQNLLERSFQKNATLKYWESGMDLGLSRDMFESFIKYQRLLQKEFLSMQKDPLYGFEVINGNRSPRAIYGDLQSRCNEILEARYGESGVNA